MDRRKKVLLTEYLPLIISFISIISCSIAFKQDLVKTMPVCFSLLIVLLSSRANKICYLMGAFNCIIYIVGYFMEGLYGSALQTAFSSVMQFATFFYWKKNSYKHATKFREMALLGRIFLLIGITIGTIICAIILMSLNANEVWLDSYTLVSGIAGPILNLFAFIEYLPLSVVGQIITLIMWFKIIIDGNLANITYLIIAIYNVYMTIRMAKTWLRLYKEQHALTNKDKPLD